jgi:hypothetical protein
MMKHFVLGALIAGAVTAMAFVSPASAQATRTWVSGVGDDANPCSRTAPCKTFAGAISKTATTGEINCLDSGGFGTLTINKSITVKCVGVIGGVLASGLPGFTVNLPAGGKAVLDGLDIEGLNGGGGTNTPGTIGVRMIGTGQVTIMNSTIKDFSGNGVDCVGTAGARCVIVNSQILNNGGGGFNVAGAAGASNVGVSIGALYDFNPAFGISVTSPSSLFIGHNTTLGTANGLLNNGGATITSFVDNEINAGASPSTPVPRR